MEQRKISQKNRILNYLLAGNTITSLEALRLFGSFRLATRIWELKQEGWNISTTMINVNNANIAQYKLIKEEE